MKVDSNLDKEFSLSKILFILEKGYKQIIFWVLIGGIFSLILSFFVFTPKYNSTLDILVNQKKDASNQEYTTQQADLQAINTYKDILKKPVILDEVLENLKERDNYQDSLKHLENSISIENQTNSQVISIKVQDKNPYMSADIANQVGKVFTKKIKYIMKVDNITIVSKAKPEKNPVSPNKKLNLLIGIVIGFFVGVVLVLLKDYFDMTVTDEKFITEEVSLPLLGSVNHIAHKNNSTKVSLKESRFVGPRHRV